MADAGDRAPEAEGAQATLDIADAEGTDSADATGEESPAAEAAPAAKGGGRASAAKKTAKGKRSRKPKPLFYKIGEACKRLDIQPYVLRYWETEFPSLKPSKSRSGQRVYSQDELEVIRRIKELLYEEGYTIAGAKKKLEAELSAGGPGAAPEEAPAVDTRAAERIEHLRRGIGAALDEAREILALLDRDPGSS